MDDWLTTTEAADLAGVSPQRVRKLLDEGRFPGALLVGPAVRGVWLVPRAEFQQWASGERKPGRPKKPKEADDVD